LLIFIWAMIAAASARSADLFDRFCFPLVDPEYPSVLDRVLST
jgi:hypothetical protein